MPELEIEPGLGLTAEGGLAANSRAASIYMTITGQKSGKLKGGSTVAKHEGTIELIGVEEKIWSPRDAQSGLPTGQRVHGPVHVAGAVDKAMPILWQMIASNENCKSVLIDYWTGISKASGIGAGTGNKSVYTIELTNAQISELKHFTAPDGKLFFTAAFTYQKILVTWVDGGITGSDDWNSMA